MTDPSPPSRPPREPLVLPGGFELFERDMTATVAADVPLAALQERLARVGQWLPIDGDPAAPVGRLVEQNSTGPLRLGYGAWRDLLLGCQFFNGRGELITAGGRAVKNVAGYDLTKLMVGQHGVLGRLVTLTTRTYRLPEDALRVEWPPDPGILSRLLPTPGRPHWAVLTGRQLYCGYFGTHAELDYLQSLVRALGPVEDLRDGVEWSVGQLNRCWVVAPRGGPRFRASVPPARVAAFAAAIAGAAEGTWAADPAFGIVAGAVPAGPSPRAAVRSAARAAGGSVAFFDDAGFLELSLSPSERRMMEELKRAFDPDGRLAPLPGDVAGEDVAGEDVAGEDVRTR